MKTCHTMRSPATLKWAPRASRMSQKTIPKQIQVGEAPARAPAVPTKKMKLKTASTMAQIKVPL